MIGQMVKALSDLDYYKNIKIIKKDKISKMFFIVEDYDYQKGICRVVMLKNNETVIDEILPCSYNKLDYKKDKNNQISIFSDNGEEGKLSTMEKNYDNEKQKTIGAIQ